jgi:hypothetical protein
MAYYDKVKDSVKGDEEQGSGASFDTLKEKAEENPNEENEDDDTPIEVVAEGGIEKKPKEKEESSEKTNPFNSSSEDQVESVDSEGIEQRLDKIIEQNKKMIEILESFGN